MLDWAFVELDKGSDQIFERCAKNSIPFVQPDEIYNYKRNGRKFWREVWDLSEVKKGHWYLKVGQNTDETIGTCHGTKVYCNNVGAKHRTRYDESNMQSTLVEVDYTEELAILSTKIFRVSKPGAWLLNNVPGEYVGEQSDFCQSGDSGSWLVDVDSHNKLAGLLFGSITNLCGPWNYNEESGPYMNVGLVTSMAEVQKSIAAWTTPRDSNGAPIGPPGVLSVQL